MIGLRIVSAAIGACGLGYCLATPMHTAQAQTGSPVLKSEEELVKSNYDQCMKDWDTSTHMTKQAWERVCRRIAADRAKANTQTEMPAARPKQK